MTIALRQGTVLTIVGPGALLHSLLSTVAVRLENGQWGSRFPWIMNGLYGGELDERAAKAACAEMPQIRKELSQLPSTQIVWDIEHPNQQPPKVDLARVPSNLAQCHITVTGRILIEEIIDNLECQMEFGGPLLIVPFDGKH